LEEVRTIIFDSLILSSSSNSFFPLAIYMNMRFSSCIHAIWFIPLGLFINMSFLWAYYETVSKDSHGVIK